MSRRIQQNDLPILPLQICLLGENRDPPLPLKRKIVQKGISVIHPARFSKLSRRVEQCLGKRGLPRIDMCQYS